MSAAGTGLPHPDPQSANHSELVRQSLIAAIREAGGRISFADFMQFALYAPGLGYYSAGNQKFGEAGDFTTAPEVSPLFGSVLARQADVVLAELGAGGIVEFGAGTGALAHALLSSLDDPTKLERYAIVEVSADLQARQREKLSSLPTMLRDKVVWVDDPATLAVDGLVIANEVLDAAPVERFRIGPDGEVLQQCVALSQDDILRLDYVAAPQALQAAVEHLQETLQRRLPVGYTSEMGFVADGVARQMQAALRRGVLLIADYGYGRETYYADDRTDGTLICHFRHHVHADALWAPGIQDITAWVDFSRIADVLDAQGLGFLGFTTQSEFLLHGGLASVYAGLDPEQQAQLSGGVKTLTLPGEMGERFKFLGFHKDCSVALPGFSGRDFGRQL